MKSIPIETATIDQLKAFATDKGLSFQANIGQGKLLEKIKGVFEGSEIDPHIVGEAHTLHATMLATLDPPKQPAPNDHWCIGCSPDPDNFTDQPCCGCERPRPTDGP